MPKEFKLGDKVTHTFSDQIGTVVGLRVIQPYTVQVRWPGVARFKKDWYNPDVLKLHKPPKEIEGTLEEKVAQIANIEEYKERYEAILSIIKSTGNN